jgi:hypothetical protein
MPHAHFEHVARPDGVGFHHAQFVRVVVLRTRSAADRENSKCGDYGGASFPDDTHSMHECLSAENDFPKANADPECERRATLLRKDNALGAEGA